MHIENLKNPSLIECINQYLYWKSSYAIVAAERYKVRLYHFAEYFGKNNGVSDITLNVIIGYHQQMEQIEQYSKGTVSYSTRILKNFFEYLKDCNIPCLNPRQIRSLKYIQPDKDITTESIFKQMTHVLEEQFFDDLIKKLVIHLLYDTGMRVSELCDLNISDIEETKRPGMRCATIRRRKSLRYNTIVWGSETNRLMNLYLGLRLCIDNTGNDALLVCRKNKGERITTRTIQRWIQDICARANIDKKITPHSFRHGKAHQVLNKSGNVRDVQAILGHVNPQSSFSYLSLNRENQIEVSGKYLFA